MALSIKTDEADRLARELSRLTGESMTQAVTVALRERLVRERASREPGLADRLMAFAERVGPEFDQSPISKEEWDWASGDED
jgi:antitoxin VapB